jgi:hypothetical protein
MTRNSALAVIALAAIVAIVIGARTSTHASPTDGPRQEEQDHCDWLSSCLRVAETIKVGDTRSSLLEVFTTEGGLSTGLQRTYVYRGCGRIKVDVQFDAVGRPPRDADGRVTLIESGDDVITKISRPYLQWAVMD